MKLILGITICLLLVLKGESQTVIEMEKYNGVFVMPCKINGLSLKFIFDTGASDVSISLTEALFMLKNGYLSEKDLIGTEYYRIANGDIQEGTKIILKEIEIGNLKLFNIQASIVHSLSAPLLLGQSALSKLGNIQFDYNKNTLTIKNGSTNTVQQNKTSINSSKPWSHASKDSYFGGTHIYKTTLENFLIDAPLRELPTPSSLEIYRCPIDATIYVIENEDERFCKVYINGYTGYISKGFIKRKM